MGSSVGGGAVGVNPILFQEISKFTRYLGVYTRGGATTKPKSSPRRFGNSDKRQGKIWRGDKAIFQLSNLKEAEKLKIEIFGQIYIFCSKGLGIFIVL